MIEIRLTGTPDEVARVSKVLALLDQVFNDVKVSMPARKRRDDDQVIEKLHVTLNPDYDPGEVTPDERRATWYRRQDELSEQIAGLGNSTADHVEFWTRHAEKAQANAALFAGAAPSATTRFEQLAFIELSSREREDVDRFRTNARQCADALAAQQTKDGQS